MGDKIHRFDIVAETLSHTRADHLDGNAFAALRCLHFRRMHLRNRSCGNRFVKAYIKVVEGAAKRTLDRSLCRRMREESHAVLQLRQVVGHVDADDIGSRRQELADLHVGRPEPLDGLGQAVAARLGLGALAGEDADERFGQADGGRQSFRRKRNDHAFAHQHPADPEEAEIYVESTHRVSRSRLMPAENRFKLFGVMRQSFQPECRAAMPPV